MTRWIRYFWSSILIRVFPQHNHHYQAYANRKWGCPGAGDIASTTEIFPVKKEQKTAENKAADSALKFRGQMNKLNRKWEFYREEAWSIGIGLAKGYVNIANYDDNLERASIVEDDISNYPRFLSGYVSSGKIVIDDRFYESHQFKDKELNISPSRHLAMRETGKTAKIYEIVGAKSKYDK